MWNYKTQELAKGTKDQASITDLGVECFLSEVLDLLLKARKKLFYLLINNFRTKTKYLQLKVTRGSSSANRSYSHALIKPVFCTKKEKKNLKQCKGEKGLRHGSRKRLKSFLPGLSTLSRSLVRERKRTQPLTLVAHLLTSSAHKQWQPMLDPAPKLRTSKTWTLVLG